MSRPEFHAPVANVHIEGAPVSGRDVIEVSDLTKEYRLGTINHGTLYQDIQSWWARTRGRDDPNQRLRDGAIESSRVAGSDRFLALSDVSFTVQDGEVLGIIGRNGAGKSTLLKILSRVTAPTQGQVRLRGRVASLLEVGTGFHPELSGRENIYLNGAILGMSKAEVASKLDEIVAFAEVEKFLDTPVKRYSSGMYVRLAFGVAAHLEPEILIVDEVLAVGDYRFQRKCLGKMSEVSQDGRTVLFVSHNMGAVRNLCTRAVLLSDGQLVENGETEKVVTRYLTKGMNSDATISYDDNPDKDIQISRVTVRDSAGEVNAYLDLLESFSIEIEYTVHEAISGVVIGCSIFTQQGECIIGTADHDLNRQRLGARKKGRQRTQVTMPGHLLNSGIYNVVIGISVPGKVIYDRRETLNIELFDSGSFVVDGGGEERRGALLLLPLEWEEE